MFVDLYFTPYITTKHNNNNGMRHETVWLDRTIHCDSIKTRRVVREATATVMIEKYRINLTFFLLFALLLTFFLLVVLLTPITAFRSNIVRNIIIGHVS